MSRPAMAGLLASLVLVPTAALGAWPAAGSGVTTVEASTMTNATDFALACDDGASVRLSWTVSPDVFVEGYQILRSRSGVAPFEILLARTTAGHLDTPDEAKGQESFTYTYTIRAGSTEHSWTTSAVAAPRSVTLTKNSCTTN